MTTDIVLARFNEDLAWSYLIKAGCRVLVYNKGEGGDLPNVGREAHTYLHHIVKHYSYLAEWTFFSQADPIAHCPDFVDIVNAWPDSYRKSAFYVAPDQNFFSNQPVRFIESNPPGDDGANDPMGLWEELFHPTFHTFPMVFTPGAIFAITRDRLLSRSRAFYQKALELTVSRPRGPWEFERLWAYLWISSAATKL